jgi:hypothetical protein
MTTRFTDLDLDVEGFAERLGADLERFATSDWSLFAERPAGPDKEGARQMLTMITDLGAESEFILLCEVTSCGIAAAAGLDPIRIQAALELGRRRGRRDVTAKIRGIGRLLRLADDDPPSAA